MEARSYLVFALALALGFGLRPVLAAPAACSPDLRAAQVLADQGIVAVRSLVFHTPEPRIAFYHKSEELTLIGEHLDRLAAAGQLSHAVVAEIAKRTKAMAAKTTQAAGDLEMTGEDVEAWRAAMLAELKGLRRALETRGSPARPRRTWTRHPTAALRHA